MDSGTGVNSEFVLQVTLTRSRPRLIASSPVVPLLVVAVVSGSVMHVPQSEARHGPLHQDHETRGAKFGDFAGWLMPLEFDGGGVLAEHTAVRERVGLFDVSHMGTFVVTGPGAKDSLNEVFTNDLNRIGPGQAQYSLLCNDRAGVIDDLFVYLVSDERVIVVPNAANSSIVLGTVERVLESSDVRVDDRSHSTAIIAVQGPASQQVIEAVGLPADLDYLYFTECDTDNGQVLVARTGYTGERGYELLVDAAHAQHWWGLLRTHAEALGGRACGLGGRDTLRTEMGYALHGHELSVSINPLEAGLSWAIGWDKTAFPGLHELRKIRQSGIERRLVGLTCVDRAIPRAGMVVRDVTDADVVLGKTTSGTFSPTLKAGIALALVDTEVNDGDEVVVDVRGRSCRAIVVRPPFVESSPRD